MTNIVVSFIMRAKNAFASIRKAWTRSIHGVVASPSTAPDQRRAGSGLSSAKETVADAHEGSATDMLVEAQDDQNGVDAIQSHPSSNEGAFAGGPSPSSTAPALLPAHAVAAAKDDSEDDSQGSAIFHPSHVTLHPSSSGGPSPSSAPPIQPPAHGASAAQDDSLGSAVSYRSTRKGEKLMSRIVKCGLIQTSQAASVEESLETIRNAQTERTLKYIDQAGAEGVQMLCMQEIFTGPYFCAEQNTRWYDSVERIPDGPTTRLMQEYAKKYNMVIIVPIYEEESTGVYYNTAAVIDADGSYLGKYRKNHIPHTSGFWEICYDRHFPEGARELGLNGAEIVFNPSATVAGLSEYLWKLEQPAHAVANGYFVGAVNRVGFEAPWNIGEFYGQSYFCDPRGQIVAIAKRDEDALVTAELDFDKIREVRNTWQFYRDRRPETYSGLVRL